MKLNSLIILFFAAATLSFTGCSKIEDALDVKFDTTFSTDLEIDVPAESRELNGTEFLADTIIDLTSNSKFNEYKDKLKSVTTKSIVLTVTSISEDTVNLSLVGFAILTPDISVSYFHNVEAMTITNGYSYAIESGSNEFDTLNAILLNGGKIAVTYSGI
ncbi:MAG: hypothetical protein C0598_06140, partial [Marinilabiliales bacterium]